MASAGYNHEDRSKGGSKATERGSRISASSRLFAPTQSSLAKKKPADGHRSDGERGRRLSDVSDLASSHSREPQKEGRSRPRRSSFPVEESHGRGETVSGDDASRRAMSGMAGTDRATAGKGLGGAAAAGQKGKGPDGRSTPAGGRKERSYSDMSSPEKPSRNGRSAGFTSSPEKPYPQGQQQGGGSAAPHADQSRVAGADRPAGSVKELAPIKAPSPRAVPPPIKTAVQGEAVRARMARPERAGDMSPRAIDMSPRAFQARGEMPFRGGEMSPRASDMSPRAFHARVDAPTYSSSRKEKTAPSRNALLGSNRVGGSSVEGLQASSLDSAEMAAMLAASKQAAGALPGAEHESWAAADAVAMGQDAVAGFDWRGEMPEQHMQDGAMQAGSRGNDRSTGVSRSTRQPQGTRDSSPAPLKQEEQQQHEEYLFAPTAVEESSASTAGAHGDLDDVSKPNGVAQRGPGLGQPGAKMEEGSPVSVLEANESDPSHLSETDSALLKEAAGHGPSAWHQQLLQGHQSVVSIQSHDEGTGAAAAAVVAAIGSPLPSYLQDISDLDFMGDISGMEQDLEYVRHVLLLSGFAGKRLPPVHSAENPIHPDVFEQLEQGITTGSVEGAQDAIIIDRARQAEERRQRRLLFDAVNEALGRRLTPYFARPVWVKPSELVIKKLPVGQYLLQEVWEEIHDWPIASSDEVYDILDDAARRDMSRGTEKWSEMGLEHAEAAFELELMILDDMLQDIAADICAADAAKKERRLRQRRVARPRTQSPMGSRA